MSSAYAFFNCRRARQKRSGVTLTRTSWLLTVNTGASPQAPKHSPSFSVEQAIGGGFAEFDAQFFPWRAPHTQ